MSDAASGPAKGRKRPMTLTITHSLSIRTNSTRLLPYLILGGQEAVSDRSTLDMMGVTHILNASCEINCWFADALSYLRIPISDEPDENAAQHFATAHAFLEDVKKRYLSGEKVVCLVHCKTGMSRSSTMLLCHLMQTTAALGMMADARNNAAMLKDAAQNEALPHRASSHVTLRDALAFIRERRPRASPNAGFMSQLLELEARLHNGTVSINLDEYKKDRFGDVRLFAIGSIDPAVGYTGNGMTSAAPSAGGEDGSAGPLVAPAPIALTSTDAAASTTAPVPVVTLAGEAQAVPPQPLAGSAAIPVRTARGRAPRDFGFPDMSDDNPVDGVLTAPVAPPRTRRANEAASRKGFGFDDSGEMDMDLSPAVDAPVSHHARAGHRRDASDVSMPDDNTIMVVKGRQASSPASSTPNGNSEDASQMQVPPARRRSRGSSTSNDAGMPDVVPPRASRRISGAGIAATSGFGFDASRDDAATRPSQSPPRQETGVLRTRRGSSGESSSRRVLADGTDAPALVPAVGDSLDVLVSGISKGVAGRASEARKTSADGTFVGVDDAGTRGRAVSGATAGVPWAGAVPGTQPMAVTGGSLRPNSRLSVETAGSDPAASSASAVVSRSPMDPAMTAAMYRSPSRSAQAETGARPVSGVKPGSSLTAASGAAFAVNGSSLTMSSRSSEGTSLGASASPTGGFSSAAGFPASATGVRTGGLTVAGTSLRPGSASTPGTGMVSPPASLAGSSLLRTGKQLSSDVASPSAVVGGSPSIAGRASPRGTAARGGAPPAGSSSLFVGGTSLTGGPK